MSNCKTKRILRVNWHTDGQSENYGSLTALYARHTAEEIGIKYNSLKQYMSRNNGYYCNTRLDMTYEPVYIAERGPRKKGIAQTKTT